jgi:hypothetical protein
LPAGLDTSSTRCLAGCPQLASRPLAERGHPHRDELIVGRTEVLTRIEAPLLSG